MNKSSHQFKREQAEVYGRVWREDTEGGKETIKRVK